MQCQNNLKQIGVALSSYLGQRNVLPMSAVAGAGHGINQSCFAQILPELEQRPLFNAYNFFVENFDPANVTVVSTKIATFLCPESPLPGENLASNLVQRADGTMYPAGSSFARCNYAANWGGSQNVLGDDFTKTKGNYRGVMMTVKVATPAGQTACVRAQDIRDGLANTIMVGEKRDSQGWNVGGYAGSEFDVGPSPYLVTDDPFLRMVFPGSFHPGQTHFVFCDGSVHPIRATHQPGRLVCPDHSRRSRGDQRGVVLSDSLTMAQGVW